MSNPGGHRQIQLPWVVPGTFIRAVVPNPNRSWIGVIAKLATERQMARIIASAGIVDWERPFQNLRSTRSTELARRGVVIQDFCRWLGHSPKVALEHYLQVQTRDFDRAATEIRTLPTASL